MSSSPSASSRWTVRSAFLAQGRRGCASAAVGRRLFLLGGRTALDNQSQHVAVLNLNTMNWMNGHCELPHSSPHCSAVAVGDDRHIFVVGGLGKNNDLTYLYDTKTNKVETL